MVDETRGITFHAGINDRLLVYDEEERVIVVRIVIFVPGVGLGMRDAISQILDDPRSLRDALGGKDTLAMDLRVADLDPRASAHFRYRHGTLLEF